MFEKTFSFWRRLVGAAPSAASGDFRDEQVDRRLWTRHLADLHGKVQLTNQIGGETIPTHIRDLSIGGASLLLDRPIPPGQILSVEIPTDEDAIRTVLACVVRLTPEKDSQWSLGCVFSRELTDEDLAHFGAKQATPSGADQRKWIRFAVEMTANFRKVGDPGNQVHSAQVLNISASGIGLAVTPPLDTGALLSLDLTHKQPGRVPRTILACVVHTSLRNSGELAVGCNFIRELSEEELQSLL